MASVRIEGVEGMRSLLGQEVGPSEWRTVTQADIDTFADLSGDDQWIHVDVERARTESPFKTTIAHGNLTLSLVDGFRKELIVASGFAVGGQCGWNKRRVPARRIVDQGQRPDHQRPPVLAPAHGPDQPRPRADDPVHPVGDGAPVL